MPIVKENGEIKATPPFSDDDVAQLRAGDHVKFYGTIYTARDAAHRRMVTGLGEGKPLPMDVTGQVIYYVGPSPARPGRIIGSAGPTTSMRLDPFTPTMLEQGLKVIIGKGGRGSVVKQALQDHKAVYLLAIGGAGALLSKTIKSMDVIAYEDLGTESIKKLEVDGFPAIVCCDMYGGDLLLAGKEQYRQQAVLGEYVSVPPAEKQADMSELLTYLDGEVRAMHKLFDRVAGDLTDDQVNHVPEGGHQNLAFCLWHYVRTEDNVIQFVIQRKPTVWMEAGWDEKFGLDSKSQGTGFTDDEARAFRIKGMDGFRQYMKDVFGKTENYIAALSPDESARKITVKPLGEMSISQCMAGMVMTHGYRHLGEIEFAKGLVAPKGGATI